MGVVAPSLDQACLSYVFKRITLNCSKARTRVIFDKLEIVKYRRRRRLLNLSWLQEVETVQKDEFPLANSYNLKDLKLNDRSICALFAGAHNQTWPGPSFAAHQNSTKTAPRKQHWFLSNIWGSWLRVGSLCRTKGRSFSKAYKPAKTGFKTGIDTPPRCLNAYLLQNSEQICKFSSNFIESETETMSKYGNTVSMLIESGDRSVNLYPQS